MVHDLPSIEFLYDFLYYDARRITSYLAQLDPDGTLTGIIKTWGRAKDTAWSTQADIKLAALERTSSSEASKLVEKQYDPAWSLPIAVLNRLNELGFVERDLNKAGIGRLTLISGTLSLIDIRMLRDMWPAILKFMELSDGQHDTEPDAAPASRQQRRQKERQPQRTKQINKEVQIMREVIQYLPHTVQMHMMTDDKQFLWGTLAPDHMVMDPDDLALKHGASVPGQWYVLAVLDAYPLTKAEQRSFHEVIGMTDLGRGMYQLLMGLQPAFGRPPIAYGVMPLLIFRTVRPGESGPA